MSQCPANSQATTTTNQLQADDRLFSFLSLARITIHLPYNPENIRFTRF